MWFSAARAAARWSGWSARRCSRRSSLKLLLVDLSGSRHGRADRLVHRRRRADARDRLRRPAAGQGGAPCAGLSRAGRAAPAGLRGVRSLRRRDRHGVRRRAGRFATARRSRSARRRRFVQLALPPSAYAHVQQPELARPPRRRCRAASACRTACSAPRSEQQTTEQVRRRDAVSAAAAAGRRRQSGRRRSRSSSRATGSASARGRPASSRAAREPAARAIGRLADRPRRARRSGPGAAMAAARVVRPGRVHRRLPRRDQPRPARMAAGRRRPADGADLGRRAADAAAHRC